MLGRYWGYCVGKLLLGVLCWEDIGDIVLLCWEATGDIFLELLLGILCWEYIGDNVLGSYCGYCVGKLFVIFCWELLLGILCLEAIVNIVLGS